MEKEVARWLHQQLGYNAAADSTLSANCRGNLKSLWEFLMANYKSPENQRHIHNVLAKHRREQEAARQAPERLQQALQQRQHLAQLDAKAVTLERTLASLQVLQPALLTFACDVCLMVLGCTSRR
jgi:tRNA U34 5-carboxymethylaminomethyl modifying GTPase MnmE/TrmE